MATSFDDNSLTADGTEQNLRAAFGDDGTFVLLVDTVNMTLGDKVTLRAKTKVRSVGTTRLAYEATYEHVQTELVKISIPIPSINELLFTLEQTAGTNRAFPWEIISL